MMFPCLRLDNCTCVTVSSSNVKQKLFIQQLENSSEVPIKLYESFPFQKLENSPLLPSFCHTT